MKYVNHVELSSCIVDIGGNLVLQTVVTLLKTNVP